MSLFISLIRSSVGKKYIMAATGSFLSFFLLAHLIGNSFSFFGKDAFNSYASHLHSLSFLLHILEVILALIFLAHILTAFFLYVDNLKARPDPYAVSKGTRSWNSRTMPYTGLILLIFILAHLENFHFTTVTATPSEMVGDLLGSPGSAIFYLFALATLGVHLSHGFWSMFQSAGINHPKYNIFLKNAGLGAAVILCSIFMLIPILALLTEWFLQ
ncbi:MAG: succinate dehydrogenase cytochrome b subunit [Proteobacteria bacterium]|nr:succinate dehydrogenase cytochrome b subunit [Pseudomonadota bacterium]MBU1709530.1 succinate dehydrogenase cytochrome b subunit [Pseudomonadota bacterium]